MKLNVSQVKVSCSKPKCRHEEAKLHRHHKRSELLFVKAFKHRINEGRYRAFCARYEKFRPRDVALICEHHHKEIHEVYFKILERHIIKLRKTPRHFSWREATTVMREFDKACTVWLKEETPGLVNWTMNLPNRNRK